MSKQESKKDEQILDTLLPDIENMSREDAEALFNETGADLRALRARLQEAAKDVAATLLKSGTPRPRALTRAIEALDDSKQLPQSTDAAALTKAAEIVRRFRTPQPVPEGAKMLKAARRSPTAATSDDDGAVDDLAADLQKELDGDDTRKK